MAFNLSMFGVAVLLAYAASAISVEEGTSAEILADIKALHKINAEPEQSVFPVMKIVKMLAAMQKGIQTEKAREEKSYAQFACFCRESLEQASKKIIVSKQGIEDTGASIQEIIQLRNDQLTELQERKQAEVDKNAELVEIQQTFEGQKAEYTANEADLTKALAALSGAVKALKSKDPSDGDSFVQIRQSVSSSLKLASHLGLALNKRHHDKLGAFLQEDGAPTPESPEYEFHSQGLVDTINDLLKDFKEQRDTLVEEWVKTENTHKAMVSNINNQLAENTEAMTTLEESIKTLTETINKNRLVVVQVEDGVKSDDDYLRDVNIQCSQRAKDWDQRSEARNGELAAIEQVLEVLSGKVVAADMNVNRLRTGVTTGEKAAHQKISGEVVGFLQISSSKTAQQKATSRITLQSAEMSTARQQAKLKQAVISQLRDEAQRLNSATLSSLIMRIAADPFGKVKDLIANLEQRINQELNDEIGKQAYCNKELGAAKHKRDHHYTNRNKINSAVAQLETDSQTLQVEIGKNEKQVKELKVDLREATKLRSDEKEENHATLEEAQNGLEGIKEALNIIKSFYRKTKRAAKRHEDTLDSSHTLDKKYKMSKVDAGFEGSYEGKQDDSVAIVGMMEVVESDFEKSIKEVKEAERKVQGDFVKYERTTKATIVKAETNLKIDSEDLEKIKAQIEDQMDDLQTQTGLLDSALKTLADLKPVCIDTAMSYQERADARHAEMAALKTALCALDTDGLEPDCNEAE